MELQIANLFDKGQTKNLPKGQVVIYEGDQTSTIYYITSGYVKVYNISNAGNQRIIFIYGPGDAFPLTSYLSGSGIARYFYECMVDSTLEIINNEQLREKIKNNLELGEALINYSNAMNEQFLQRVDILSVNDARRKIIALLDFLAKKAGSGGQRSIIKIPMTQQDIANMCGLTRETASMQLLRMKQQDILGGTKNLIVNTAKVDALKSRLAIST